MKKIILICLLAVLAVAIITTFTYVHNLNKLINQLASENKKADDFCNALELQDYVYDCSEWWNENEKYNITLDEPYEITCEFGSRQGHASFGAYSCTIHSYLYKKGLENIEVFEVNYCMGKTLEEAFNLCKKRLPKELESIKIIEPRKMLK